MFCLAAAMFMLVVACSGKTYAPDNPPDYGLNQKTADASFTDQFGLKYSANTLYIILTDDCEKTVITDLCDKFDMTFVGGDDESLNYKVSVNKTLDEASFLSLIDKLEHEPGVFDVNKDYTN